MERRQFLQASGVAASVGLAGCSAFSTEHLTPTTEEEEHTVHLQYGDGDEYIATLSLISRWRDDSHERYYPVRVHLWKERESAEPYCPPTDVLPRTVQRPTRAGTVLTER